MENVKLAFPSYYHFSFSCKILKLNGSDYREVFLAYYIQQYMMMMMMMSEPVRPLGKSFTRAARFFSEAGVVPTSPS